MIFNEFTLLFGIFISAFVSATLLPIPTSSELAFIGLMTHKPHLSEMALIIATLGNSAGSLTSYFIARKLPEKYQQRLSPRTLQRVQRHGAPILALAWLPIVGDLLPLAAGWLRLNVWQCVLWIVLGKLARYAFLYFMAMYFQAA